MQQIDTIAASRTVSCGERTRALTVCHVSMHLKTGGLERLLVEFARRHSPERFRPIFVALQDLGSPAADIKALGLPVHTLDIASIGKRNALQKLRALLIEQQVSGGPPMMW
jgi:hypothetical protein